MQLSMEEIFFDRIMGDFGLVLRLLHPDTVEDGERVFPHKQMIFYFNHSTNPRWSFVDDVR